MICKLLSFWKYFFLVMIFLSYPTPSQGQLTFHHNHPCGNRILIIQNIKESGKTIHGVGISADGNLIEIWVNNDGDDPSWIILLTLSDGEVTCVIGIGNEWMDKFELNQNDNSGNPS